MTGFEPHPERRPAIVTGASSGIGEAAARALAAAGHPVVLGARRVERCDAVAASIRDGGGEALALPLDVSDASSIEGFVKDAEAAMGLLEVVVSNAGDVLPATVASTDPDDFAAQVDVNLLGAQRLVTLVVPGMVERRRGDVVFVGSEVVRAPRPMMASYVSSKWGLEGMARGLQMELEGTGVRASIVSPGPTLTEMGSSWDGATIETVLALWKRWGLVRHDGYLAPQGVAAAIVAAVSAPRGTHLRYVEVEPEAPVRSEERR